MRQSVWIPIILLLLFYLGILLIRSGRFKRFPDKGKIGILKNIVLKKCRTFISIGSENAILNFIKKVRREMKKEKYESEIYEGISYLRNLIAIERGKKMSTPWILEELADLQGIMQPHYLKLLHYVRMNHKEEGLRIFSKDIDSAIANDYGRLLLQWEETEAQHWWETLKTYQGTIKEIKRTKQRKTDELMSDLIYFPVVINVMLVLMNFIYVAYFIEQQKQLLWVFQ